MSNFTLNKNANLYQQVGVHSQMETASPYRLIQMLLEGVLDKIAIASGFMQRQNRVEAGKKISVAMAIIDTLRMSLDKEIGGQISQNLDDLYDYSNRRLLLANSEQNPAYLDEVAHLIREIKAGWDAIPTETVIEYEAKLKK